MKEKLSKSGSEGFSLGKEYVPFCIDKEKFSTWREYVLLITGKGLMHELKCKNVV